MTHHAKFDFPHDKIKVILQSSYREDKYYGVDSFESKRMKILLAKYGSKRAFHSLPGHLTANLYPFVWDRLKQVFRLDESRLVTVQLNTLKEAVVLYPVY